MTTFKGVRVAAWESLYSKAWDDGYPRYCSMQDRHEHLHIGVYCNALSHVEALEEFLLNATWCDDITMEDIEGDESSSERLLRFYDTAFLLMAECYEDLKDIAATCGDRTWSSPFEAVNGFINTVVKHRRQRGGGYHTSNHHGPYFFQDDPSLASDSAARCTSVGNYRDLRAGVVAPLLVPSLVIAADTLAESVASMASTTEPPEVIAKIDAAYGRPLD